MIICLVVDSNDIRDKHLSFYSTKDACCSYTSTILKDKYEKYSGNCFKPLSNKALL